MFALNGLSIELLQPVGGPSPWRDHLDTYGEGLHHFGFSGVSNLAETTAFLVSKGGKQVVGGAGFDSAYVDLRNSLGFTIELSRASPITASTNPVPGAAAGAPQKFGDNPIAYTSIIVPDAEKAATFFTELAGVPMPKISEPKIVFPADFTGDRTAHPTLAMVPLSGSSIAITAPVGGASPWRENVDRYGPAMHHIGVRIKGMADNIAYLTQKGGKLLIGGPDVGYCWMDLRPNLPLLLELNGR
jgi:catechol 2,3-dioxygenase-like lactoylglutathione lyase family enzyme